MDLEGKRVLVTGGTGSLGQALCRRLLTGGMGSSQQVTLDHDALRTLMAAKAEPESGGVSA